MVDGGPTGAQIGGILMSDYLLSGIIRIWLRVVWFSGHMNVWNDDGILFVVRCDYNIAGVV